MSSFTFSRTRTFDISTSLKYLGRLWQNILKDEMVCHNQMMGLPLKGSCMESIAWLFIVILKKPYCMSNVEPKRISSIETCTTPSFLGKYMWTPTNWCFKIVKCFKNFFLAPS
jgi:hypothetical protein